MKKFEYPEIEVIAIAVEDVIATSSCDSDYQLPPGEDM